MAGALSSSSDVAEVDPSHLEILLIAINYAPEPTGSGPYTAGLADHYASRGHVVQVITGIPHYPWWRAKPRMVGRSTANPLIGRYRHYVPKRPTLAGRALYETTWLASASRGLIGRSPNVVIGVVTNVSAGILAWTGSRLYGVPFGLIFQDLLGPAAAQAGSGRARRIAPLLSRVEGFLARRADRVAVISEGFRPYLQTIGVPPARILRVRNWTRWESPTESNEKARARLGWALTDFVCLHAGNMGQKQGLDNLLEAARLFEDENVRIVLAGDGNDRNRLIRRAKTLGLCNVSFLDLQPAGRFEDMLQAANVLLVQQRGSVSDMALPSKLTAYFASGRPIIAAVAPASAAADEIRVAGAGILVNPEDPPALAESIIALKRSSETARRLGQAGDEHARLVLSRDEALAGYDRLLEGLLAAKPIGR